MIQIKFGALEEPQKRDTIESSTIFFANIGPAKEGRTVTSELPNFLRFQLLSEPLKIWDLDFENQISFNILNCALH